jgi:hypothetical protein
MSAESLHEADPGAGPNAAYLALLEQTVDPALATEDGSLSITFVVGGRSTSAATNTRLGNSPGKAKHL